MKDLVFRVDAGSQVGTGHLMRCLALAQAWRDGGGEATFITACRNENLLRRLDSEGFCVHKLATPHPDPADWEFTRGMIANKTGAWLVLDGYHYDESYQQKIKAAGYRLLAIDDMAHLEHYYADIVLNQNLHAGQLHYNCEPDTKLLLGTKYVLLRREFLNYKDQRRTVPETARRVLVTMGGSDPNNVTLKVIQALRKIDIPGLEATVVVGAGNPYADTLEAAAVQSPISVRIVRNADNMPQLMTEADVAVTALGITLWEICFSGLPALVIAHSDYQQNGLQAIEQKGVATSLGLNKNVDTGEIAEGLRQIIASKEIRKSMSCTQQEIVDGLGVKRVLERLRGQRA
jgi:UDP-2,4-diacetamido-2,4,6-trideoxy-beta-L-altropyranose hydrolase